MASSSLILGTALLTPLCGVEPPSEPYDLGEGLHHIVEVLGHDVLRIREAQHPVATESENVVALLSTADLTHEITLLTTKGCTYDLDLSIIPNEPYICVALRSAGVAGLTITVRSTTRNGTQVNQRQCHVLSETEPCYINDHEIISLHLPERSTRHHTFSINFDCISANSARTVVPSSEALEAEIEPCAKPTLRTNPSFVKETPTTSRYFDALQDKSAVGSDERLRNNDASPNAPLSTSGEQDFHTAPPEIEHGGEDQTQPTTTSTDPPNRSAKKKPKTYNKDRTMVLDDLHESALNSKSQQSTTQKESEKADLQAVRPSQKRLIEEDAQTPERKRVRSGHGEKVNKDLDSANIARKADTSQIPQKNNQHRSPTASSQADEGQRSASQVAQASTSLSANVGLGKTKSRSRKVTPDIAETALSSESLSSLARPSPRRKQRVETKSWTVIFSSSDVLEQRPVRKFVESHLKISEEVVESVDLLCIGGGKLVTTSKVLKAVLLGKPIVSDQWITDSASARRLLPHHKYHMLSDQEVQWQLADGWSDGSLKFNDAKCRGRELYITPKLRETYGTTGFKAIQQLGYLMGFQNVTTYPAASIKGSAQKYIALVGGKADPDVKTLESKGIAAYQKDLLNASIFAGCLQDGDQFIITGTTSVAKQRARKTRTSR